MDRERKVAIYQVHLAFIDIVGNKRLQCLLMEYFAGRTLKIAEQLDRNGCDWNSEGFPGRGLRSAHRTGGKEQRCPSSGHRM
jgi:hypothetical protein